MPDLGPQRAVGTPKPASVDTRIACHLIGQDQVRHGDAVIETPDGRVIGVEVKAGATNNKPGKQTPTSKPRRYTAAVAGQKPPDAPAPQREPPGWSRSCRDHPG